MNNKIKTELIIGTRAYPVDNSYSFPVNKDHKMIPLAGSIHSYAKKVAIVSQPYKIKIKCLSGSRMKEFVTVEYGGKLFVVLNRFKNYPC